MHSDKPARSFRKFLVLFWVAGVSIEPLFLIDGFPEGAYLLLCLGGTSLLSGLQTAERDRWAPMIAGPVSLALGTVAGHYVVRLFVGPTVVTPIELHHVPGIVFSVVCLIIFSGIVSDVAVRFRRSPSSRSIRERAVGSSG
ncbi:MAG: hypothetical protein DHS20C16_26450 [Phycisphaerae bacterium]|nr:MAG: hypothetical protein DHS20C16_26450 [Phycisphaerae bacterium]